MNGNIAQNWPFVSVASSEYLDNSKPRQMTELKRKEVFGNHQGKILRKYISKWIYSTNIYLFIYLFIYSSPEDMLLNFRERGREGETEGETHRCERETSVGLPFMHTPTRDQTRNLGMCPDWELNPQPFGVWGNAHQLSHTGQGFSSNICWVLLCVKPVLYTEDTMVNKTKNLHSSWSLQKARESINEKHIG